MSNCRPWDQVGSNAILGVFDACNRIIFVDALGPRRISAGIWLWCLRCLAVSQRETASASPSLQVTSPWLAIQITLPVHRFRYHSLAWQVWSSNQCLSTLESMRTCVAINGVFSGTRIPPWFDKVNPARVPSIVCYRFQITTDTARPWYEDLSVACDRSCARPRPPGAKKHLAKGRIARPRLV